MTQDGAGGSRLMQVLHVIGSPKGEASASTRMAEAFLDQYCLENPHDSVTTLDVWSADLPEYDGELAAAKLAPLIGEPLTPTQIAAWDRVLAIVETFASHSKIVISTPMWNFALPYRLKHYIDLLVQPGVTFGLDDAFEHIGLLDDRPVQLILTRSSAFTDDSPDDFQLSYLTHILGFIGLHDVKSLVFEGTTLPDDQREEFLTRACEQCRLAAAGF